MPLNLEHPESQQYIRSYDTGRVLVGETTLTHSFYLSPDELYPNWSVTSVQELTADGLQPLLALSPELVLLGTGTRQIFPPHEILMLFLREGIGVEVMNSDAACRTFNICAQEGRRVVAGIILD